MSIEQEVRIATLEAELEMERAKNKPKTLHVKPISAERIGEIVADVVRGRG